MEELKRYFKAVFTPYCSEDEAIFDLVVSVASEVARSRGSDAEANRYRANIARCVIPFRRIELPRTETVRLWRGG